MMTIIINAAMTDVYLFFNGTVFPNNSYINVDMIGSQDNNSLFCCTNNEYCCHGNYTLDKNPLGAWKYPNGSSVAYFNITLKMQYANLRSRFDRNRNWGTVRLMRIMEPTERGHFCCEIPDSSNVTQTLCTYIVDEIPINILDVQPKTQHVCTGQNAAFSVAIYNVTVPSYVCQWQKDGVAIEDGKMYSGTNTEILVVKNVSMQDVGVYRCAVTDHIGFVISDQASLQVLNQCSE